MARNSSGDDEGSINRHLSRGLKVAGAVLLAQLFFWVFLGLSGSRPPHPRMQLAPQGAGRYWDEARQASFTLTYTDHLPISVTVRPATPVVASYHRWVEGRLTPSDVPTRTVDVTPGDATVHRVAPLQPGPGALVAETPPGHHAIAGLWYLPRINPYNTTHVTRTAYFTVTPVRIDVLYRIAYGPEADDADLKALIDGSMPAGLFLKRAFYATKDAFTADALTDIGAYRPAFRGPLRVVEIPAASDQAFYNPERLPLLLDVTAGSNGGPTLIHLALAQGARLRSCRPAPTYASAGRWTWRVTEAQGTPTVSCSFGGRIDPTQAPVLWGRHQLIRLARSVWAWGGLSWYVVWSLPWVIPWLFGALAALPLLYLRRVGHTRRSRRVATLGLTFAGCVAVSATTARLAATLVPGLSQAGLLWAGVLAGLGVLWPAFAPLPGRWDAGVALLAPVVTGALLATLSRDGRWMAPGAIALLGAPVLGFVVDLGRRAFAAPRRRWGWLAGTLLLALLLFFALPTAHRPADYSPYRGWSLNPGRELALLSTWVGLPYVALLLTLSLLRRRGGRVAGQALMVQMADAAPTLQDAVEALCRNEAATPADQRRWRDRRERERRQRALALGTLLFAVFAVGLMRRPLTTFAALLPIAPLLAWGGFRLLTRPEETRIPYPLRILLAAPRRRREIVRGALGMTATAEEAQALPECLRPLAEASTPPLSTLALAFGRADGRTPWERGLAAATRMLVLVIPLTILFAPGLSAEIANRAASAFGPLEVLAVFVAPFVLRWLLYAFVLGYFFPHLRGQTGWEKGLYLGLVIGLANLTQDVLLYAQSVADVKGLLVETGVTLLMLSIVAVWSFDWPRVSEAGGRPEDLRALYGLSTLTGYLVAMVPSVTTVVIEATQGRLDGLLRSFIEMVLPPITQL
jgi:hypothetical protein